MSTIDGKCPEQPSDEMVTAYHEAGHTVTMWRLGFGIKKVSIEPTHDLKGFAEASERDEPFYDDARLRRFTVEQASIYLHAGDVAARLLQPEVALGQAQRDHDNIHTLMFDVEDDGAAHVTWCIYLWQRAYALLAWPGQWYLVVGLANQLLLHRTLSGEETEHYLRVANSGLSHDPRMPNAKLVGELAYVCSPWHRRWYETSMAAIPAAKRGEVPASIAALSAKGDVRPLLSVLGPLSARARNLLRRLDIQTVRDLGDWNQWSLSSFRGAGERTVAEIVRAAARAGVCLAPLTRQFPWQLNPGRWETSR